MTVMEVIALYEAGLISKEEARKFLSKLIGLVDQDVKSD